MLVLLPRKQELTNEF